jgi:hypothetical protein
MPANGSPMPGGAWRRTVTVGAPSSEASWSTRRRLATRCGPLRREQRIRSSAALTADSRPPAGNRARPQGVVCEALMMLGNGVTTIADTLWVPFPLEVAQ